MILDIFRSGKSTRQEESEEKLEAANSCDDDRLAFSSYAEQSGLPPLENWPIDITTIVTPSHRAPEIEYELQETIGPDLVPSFPMNGDVVLFDSPNFRGKIVHRMRDVPLQPSKNNRMTNAHYFNARSRQYQWTVQGRFKRRIRFGEVITGQEFGRPFRNTPSSSMVKRGLDMLKHKLPETFEW